MKKKNKILLFVCSIIATGIFYSFLFSSSKYTVDAGNYRLDDQDATIMSIKKVMPAVVSIVVYDQTIVSEIDLGTGETKYSKEKQEKGRGTGFIISKDGYVITNKHVVNLANVDTGEYKIFLNSGKQYYGQLIGKDPMNDLAVLKIFDKNLPYVELGDSDKLEIGSTVIAIGNALGRYDNSATKGIVSALGRNLQATSDNTGISELLSNVIQTDAQINHGNSGGPLIDLNGKVVGINVATESSGSAIGFAIPINDAKPVIKSINESGRIIRVKLGVYYAMITPTLAAEKNLKSQTGAWLTNLEDNGSVIVPDSPASQAGLMENDIILEVNAIKIDGKNTLLSVIQKYKPGNKIGLRILRDGKIIVKTVILTEAK